jgi:DNA-binding NtrC family response regulator
MANVMIVDDEEIVRFALSGKLKEHGFSVIEACSGRDAVDRCMKEDIDAVLLDLKMPEMDGIETLQELKGHNNHVPVIIVTAFGDIPTAVQAIKLGAYDFIEKPPQVSKLILTLDRAIEKAELEKKIRNLDSTLESSFECLLGRSSAMKRVIAQIKQVSGSDFSIILQGETGTGKTFIANIMHNLSKRANGPFVTLDIGSIPETLIESELFGYEKGAFTGAENKKTGYFEMAEEGTLFIDEVQNMPLNLQGKLLKVVEEKKFYPIGGNSTVNTNVRIIVATNSDLPSELKRKKFRADLYYRLNEFTIQLPPLRKRADGIASLARTFLSEASMEFKKRVASISDDAVDFLVKQPWPGNVRELKNTIRRAVLLCYGNELTMQMVSQCMGDTNETQGKTELSNLQSQSFPMSLEEAEKITIRVALDHTKGNRTKAAQILQISHPTLLRKIKMYDL